MAKKRKERGGDGEGSSISKRKERIGIADKPEFISRNRARLPKKHQQDEEYVATKLSQKILKEARKQQKEIEDDEESELAKTQLSFSDAAAEIRNNLSESDDEDFGGFSETQSRYEDYEEINEEDERVLEAFMSKDAPPLRTLADIIIAKIREKDAQVAQEERPLPALDSAVIDVYKGVGKLLTRFTTGKMPKAFKVIPSLSLWEDVLYLTEPEKWSPNGMFQATRIFSSNLPPKKARRFYNLVLLPRVREDIKKNKRLHFALYQALKKSLYKPSAFFMGILLPLCQSGTCSLREAVVIGSIIQKVSIPPLHSSVALMKIAEMDYCGTNSYFIKLFLDKKYALPYRVIDAVTAHFMRFMEDTRVMPVIWHLSLLSFVQRYKNELTKEDKDNIDRLIQHQKHYKVTPEIKRELRSSRNRGEKEFDFMSINILIC
ncbi:hypothetical protein AMTR_s00072p00173000 [Amborella trichopoda]|uniref:Bystin n=1 Tax=Amborella trichopoda TaxID=13333 RepID=W1NTI9_AMBTC|nr:hypothetical protein AMTR_s00072p00173000 [Amborella trichopoda]